MVRLPRASCDRTQHIIVWVRTGEDSKDAAAAARAAGAAGSVGTATDTHTQRVRA